MEISSILFKLKLFILHNKKIKRNRIMFLFRYSKGRKKFIKKYLNTQFIYIIPKKRFYRSRYLISYKKRYIGRIRKNKIKLIRRKKLGYSIKLNKKKRNKNFKLKKIRFLTSYDIALRKKLWKTRYKIKFYKNFLKKSKTKLSHKNRKYVPQTKQVFLKRKYNKENKKNKLELLRKLIINQFFQKFL